MTRSKRLIIAWFLGMLSACAWAASAEWSDPAPHKEGFVTANGIRLEYLDWGGTGTTLIFIHGLGDNPHIFDDLAPAFTDHHRVIAYARRGHGRSENKPPYDDHTLTKDLLGLMDSLGIVRADLAGWSLGGNEATTMAVEHPDRVDKIIYLDGIYDYADPDFAAARKVFSDNFFDPPPGAMSSLPAYRAFEKAGDFASLDDMRKVEAYVRESVNIQSDGSVTPRIPDEVINAVLAAMYKNPLRSYSQLQCPVLALYVTHGDDPHVQDVQRREVDAEYDRRFAPFRAKSLARIRREIATVEVIKIPGGHSDFFLTSRTSVVRAMRRFLDQATH
jgi:pimeloyl-ACP methyl ester carboxylesterase